MTDKGWGADALPFYESGNRADYSALHCKVSTNTHRFPAAIKPQMAAAIQNPRGSDARTRLNFPNVKGNLPSRKAEIPTFIGITKRQNLPTMRNPNNHVATPSAIKTNAVSKFSREMIGEANMDLD